MGRPSTVRGPVVTRGDLRPGPDDLRVDPRQAVNHARRFHVARQDLQFHAPDIDLGLTPEPLQDAWMARFSRPSRSIAEDRGSSRSSASEPMPAWTRFAHAIRTP